MAVGDFTNVRVESDAPSQVVIRYSYAGAGNLTVWRSTDNVTYTQIISIPSDYGSYPTLYDNTGAEQTLYYYKLSDDAGATKTAAVSAKTQKGFLRQPRAERSISLDKFTAEEDVNARSLNELRDKIETWVNSDYAAPVRKNCIICPTDGALVLDCADGCYSFSVRQEDVTDINSISLNCDRTELYLPIPEGTTTEVCGWPQDFGFTGDECYQSPVSGPIDADGGGAILRETKACQQTRYRYPNYPCKDYTKDCYDNGSLDWSLRFNFGLAPCSPANITGCCSGNVTRRGLHGSNGNGVIRSGYQEPNRTHEPRPLAGYSLHFAHGAQDGSASPPWETFLYLKFNQVNRGRPIAGKPIFGCAINVLESSTTENFTGLVLLMDYKNDRMLLGQYTNGNLRTSMPGTIYYQTAMVSDVAAIMISNFPAGPSGSGLFYAFNYADTATIFILENAGYTAPASTANLGAGYIWVGNSTLGNHITDIVADDLTSIQVWGL